MMGREVRMVPADWQHPTEGYPDGEKRHVPLLDGSHAEAVREWEEEELPSWLEGERLWREEGKAKGSDGVRTIEQVVASTEAHRRPRNPTYEWWAGERPNRPDPAHYMPDWPDEQRSHFMMYENTSEGTPISPACATAEELARWLADNGASAFAARTATYDEWLATIRRGSAVSAVITGGVFRSGVEAMAEH